MKSFLGFVAVCFTAALIGCQTTTETVSPGAVSECGAQKATVCTKTAAECCGQLECRRAQLGAVSDKAECSFTKEAKRECQLKKQSECTKAKDANLGAVSDEKAECHHKKKTECTKAKDANLGAVSDEKSECHHGKSDGTKVCPFSGETGIKCTGGAEANLGAVSEKAGCGANRVKKSRCGSN